MNTKSILVLPFVLLGALLQAQPVNNYLKNVVMPSPTAASLGKYTDIPVSYYSGVPNISIPIYTLTEGPLSLSVSLSYHASGVKVGEAPSWVGQNWSLNAGGMISRTTQGLRDEESPNGWLKSPAIPTPPAYDANGNVISGDHCGFYEHLWADKDGEPDIFSFNFAGNGGKFYFKKDGSVVLVPQQDIKIVPQFSANTAEIVHLKGFTVTTPDGTRYLFGDTGDGSPAVETNIGGGGNLPEMVTGWYLKKIETPDSKYAISLNYAGDYSRTDFQPNRMDVCPDPAPGGNGLPNEASNYTFVKGKRITSITTSTETVTFTPGAAREDLDVYPVAPYNTDPPKVLASISIATGTFQKKFDLTYDYWVDNSSDAVTTGSTKVNKRLRLLNVQEKSSDLTIVNPPWTFEYFSKSGSPNFMPHRISRSVDHWGFYNEKNNGVYSSIQPNTPKNLFGSCTHGGNCNLWGETGGGTSDRSSNETAMKYGTLKKITYPTGGYTEFDFEANDYYSTNPVNDTINLLHIDGAYSIGGYTCNTATFYSNPQIYSFSQSTLNEAKCEWKLKPNTYLCQCVEGVTSMRVKVYNASTNALYAQSALINISCSPSGGTTGNGNLSTFFTPALQPNVNYKFELVVTQGGADFKIRLPFINTSNNVKVGGLRIKQIKTHDAVSSANDIIRTYEYRDSTITSRSSGVLYGKPNYVHTYSWFPCRNPAQCGSICAPGQCPQYQFPTGGCNVNFYENSITPLSSFEGYHIGYYYVKENFNGNGSKTYTYYTESASDPAQYPTPPAPARILAGNLKYSTTRNAAGTILATESHAAYNDAYTESTDVMYKEIQNNCGRFTTIYKIRTRPYRDAIVANALDGVATSVTYTYDAQNRHLFPVTMTMTNSDGKVELTEFTYNHDYTNGTLKTELLNRNIIATPWKTAIKVNNVEVDGTELEYAFFNTTTGAWQSGASGGFPRPYKYYNFEKTWDAGGVLTGPGKTLKGTINSYDGKGNPASFTTANWADPETYTWNSAGLILTRTFKSHIVTYDYYTGTRLMRSITDIDGRKTGFTYDKLMRLAKATKDNASVSGGVVVDGKVKTEYTYHYKEPSPGDQNNWVKTTNTFAPKSGSSLTTTETFEYLDGLGRPLQTVKKAWSPTSKDVVNAVAYDNQGRLSKQYTPFMTAVGTGAFATIPVNQSHTLTQYESSPLGRVSSVTPPGWYATTTTYGANAASEVGYFNGSSSTSYYPANTLSKTTVTTPQSDSVTIQTITWKDKKGRLVLSSRQQQNVSGNKADTYTLYDDKDRVVRVLPPGVGTGSGDAGLRFDYAYDASDRMTSKKVPDMAAVAMKYNNRDQLVLTQDGNLLAAGKWMLTKYDDYGRPVSSGLHTGSNPDPNNGSLAYSEQHTATTYGTSGLTLGKITQTQTWIPGFATPITRSFAYDAETGRMLTDNGNNHLSNAGGSDNYTYDYDYAGNRLTETRVHKTSSGATALTLVTRNTYDHAGRNSALYHKIDANAEIQLASYTYDFRDRLTDKGLGAVTSGGVNSFLQSVDYAYNDLDWLTSINGASSFSSLSQTGIPLCSSNPTTPDPAESAYSGNPDNNDIFKLDLYYNTPGFSGSGFGVPSGQRNGNISQIMWQTRGRERQLYTLRYDYLDRLTSAHYTDVRSTGTAALDKKFRENITYSDARGNIASIDRNGLYKTTTSATCWTLGQIDNLAYTYITGTNRLQKIADSAPTGGSGNPQRNAGFNPGAASSSAVYSYDANGNMTSDPYKNMTVEYNHLNLPKHFQWLVDPLADSYRHIWLTYDHTGKKLRKRVDETSGILYTQDYVNGLEYRTNGSGGSLTLEAIYHEEGRITPNGSAHRYEYTIKDHLGNARISFADLNDNKIVDVPGDIIQENHYYAFGMNMNYSWMDNTGLINNRYQYNGKELNDDFGVNLSDYGARWYDAAVGRWWSVDNLSDQPEQIYLSPYNYTWNNPVKLTDPDGNCPRCLKALGKTLVKSVAKGKLDLSEVTDIIDAGKTLLDPKASLLDKGLAVFDIVSPVSSKEAKALGKAIGFADDANDTKKAAAKINKNANNAEGNFVLYEVKDADTGKKLKVGKANADDVMSDGKTIRRVHTSERKAQKAGYPNAQAEVVQPLGKTTTGKAKESEAARVRAERANGNSLPLNKEKDKRYHNN